MRPSEAHGTPIYKDMASQECDVTDPLFFSMDKTDSGTQGRAAERQDPWDGALAWCAAASGYMRVR